MQGNLDRERDRERVDTEETGRSEQKGGRFESWDVIELDGKREEWSERKMEETERDE